jgi:hypothetical protein
MKHYLGALICCAVVGGASAEQSGRNFDVREALRTGAAETKQNVTCFKTGESAQGMTKICYYDCLGSPAAITVRAIDLCPLSIKR